jgi:hypothetical protein
VQAFFGGMEKIAQHFVGTFYELPPGALDALMQAAVRALGMQERYSLAYACSFLVRALFYYAFAYVDDLHAQSTFVTCTAKNSALSAQKDAFAHAYGRGILREVLIGLAGAAPRSATPNLVDLLSTLAARYPAESRAWAADALFSVCLSLHTSSDLSSLGAQSDFVSSRAGDDAKRAFVQAISGCVMSPAWIGCV